MRLRASTAATLEVESGLNDPMAILLTLIATELALGRAMGAGVSPASAVADTFVRDLPLPEGCLVTLVVRDRGVVVPRGSTALLPGDQVCAFVLPEGRALLDLLFGGASEESA